MLNCNQEVGQGVGRICCNHETLSYVWLKHWIDAESIGECLLTACILNTHYFVLVQYACCGVLCWIGCYIHDCLLLVLPAQLIHVAHRDF